MRKVSYIISIFFFIITLYSCAFNNNDIKKNDTSDDGVLVTLTNEEMTVLLQSEKEFQPHFTCIEWIMDSLINNQSNNLSSLYLFEITSVKNVLCLYMDKDFDIDFKYDQFGKLINDERKGQWIEYSNIDSVKEKWDGKNLSKTYFVYEMIIIKDIFSHSKINYKTVFYEEYYWNGQSNIKSGYYLLYPYADNDYSGTYTNMRSMMDNGFVYEVIKEDLYYYIILSKQQRIDGETYDILGMYVGKYYDLIKPYLVDDPTLTKKDDYYDSYIDYTKLDIYDLVEIINNEKKE